MEGGQCVGAYMHKYIIRESSKNAEKTVFLGIDFGQKTTPIWSENYPLEGDWAIIWAKVWTIEGTGACVVALFVCKKCA